MSKLTFLIGAPRSGKSTYASRWVRESVMRVIVCSDDIRMALHGDRYNFLSETFVFAIKHVMIRALLRRGFEVLVDGTNSSDVSIQRMLEIDPKAEVVIIDTPEDVCIKRAIETNQRDLIPVIENINKNIARIKKVGFENLRKQILDVISSRNAR